MADSTLAAEFAYAICATVTHRSYSHQESTIKEQPSPIRIIWTVTYLTARIVCELLIRFLLSLPLKSIRNVQGRLWQCQKQHQDLAVRPAMDEDDDDDASRHILTPFGLDSGHPYLVPLGKQFLGLISERRLAEACWSQVLTTLLQDCFSADRGRIALVICLPPTAPDREKVLSVLEVLTEGHVTTCRG